MKSLLFCLGIGTVGALPVSAFTIDFTGLGLVGTAVSSASPLVIDVPDYGEVSFSMSGAQMATVGTSYGDDAIEVATGDTVVINFLDGPVGDVQFVGLALGEEEEFQGMTISTTEFTIQLVELEGKKGDGAGLERLTFSQVPEPSAALLGGLGVILLLGRRRRD